MFPLRDTIPSRSWPWMTWLVVLANAAVFAYELWLPADGAERLITTFGLVPLRFAEPESASRLLPPGETAWALVTSQFLHGGWMHVIANLWSLLIFGDNVEDRVGSVRFLIFYLLCGIAAGALHVVTATQSPVPTIGASGAIAGVMGAYLVLFPRARVLTLIPIVIWPVFVEVPAVVFLLFWFVTQFASGALALVGGGGEGIAWWAHIGGFLAGIALLPLFKPSERRGRQA